MRGIISCGCPKDKHKDYDEGKETTLVRLILNTLPAEYDNAVHHVRNLMAIREMVKGGDIDSITNLDDAVKINYDTSWLPPYKELRVGLINSWLSKKRRWDEEKSSKSKVGHPVIILVRKRNPKEHAMDVANRVTCAERLNVKQARMLYGAGLLRLTWRKFKRSLEKHRQLGRDLCREDQNIFVIFTKKAFANMQKDAISIMMVQVVVNDKKEMAKEKAKAKVKEKEKDAEKGASKECKGAQHW
jgi:hypothetical protein